MPKLVCSKCQVEFRPATNGVKVIEHASFGPYKIWQADEWECPKCLVRVVAGFAIEPLAEHYQPGFSKVLKEIRPDLLRHDFERPQG